MSTIPCRSPEELVWEDYEEPLPTVVEITLSLLVTDYFRRADEAANSFDPRGG